MSGQTTGNVTGYTGAGAAGAKNNAAAPETEAELDGWDALQMLLDLGGMIPGLGVGADLLNAAVSAFRGDFWGAALSVFSAIPLVGDAAGLAKIAKNGEKYLNAVKVVEKKLLPMLPPALRKKVEDFIAKIKTKLDELLGKKPEPPKKPEPAPTKTDGGEVQGKGKKGDGPACPTCPSKASPINPILGAKVLAGEMDVDFDLSGPLPLTWQRTYVSNNHFIGWLGQGWCTPLEAILEMPTTGGVNFVDEFGRVIEFPSVAKGGEFYSRSEQTTLLRDAKGAYSLALPDGNVLHFGAKDGRTRLLSAIVDRNGNQILIERAKGYPLPTFVHASGGQLLELMWTDTGHLTGVYELRGVPDKVPNAHGEAITDTWERVRLAENVERVTLVTYAFDTLGDLRQVFNCAGEMVREFGWQDHLMTAHRSGGVFEAFYEYEGQTDDLALTPASRVIRHWTNTAQSLALSYEKNQTVAVDQSGNSEIFHFIVDANGHRRWTGTTNAKGNRSQRTLDINGNVLSVSDPVGNSTGYAYNRASKPISITDPSGAVTRLEWNDALGLVSAITDPLNRTTRFDYDERGNLTQQTEPDGAVTCYERDQRGLPVTIVDALGGRKTLTHNALGQVTSYTDCSARTTHFEYGRNANLICVKDALGQETYYTYDSANRLIKEQRPDGSTESFAYDAAGHLIEHTDAMGAVTQYQLAPDGLPIARINALGASLKYEYDPARRLSALINENSARYTFQYNPTGQLVEECGFDGKRTTYEYDDAGYLTEQTEAAGSDQEVITRYQRDLMGRLLGKTTGLLPKLPTSHTRFEYDRAGQMVAAYTADTTTRLEYDRAGRLARERVSLYLPDTDTLLADTTLEHLFDALGNRINSSLPSAAIQPKAWHELLAGEAAEGNAPDDASSYTKLLNHLYYGSGHLHQINLNGQPITDIERDELHREVSRSQGPLATNYALDALGRLSAQQVSRAGGLPSVLSPLLAQHLPPIRKPNPRNAMAAPKASTANTPLIDGALIQRQYGYDAAGNLLAQHDWSRPVGYSYDALGRVTHAQPYADPQRKHASRSETFAFDPAHNLLNTLAADASQTTGSSTGLIQNNRVTVYEDKRYSYDDHGRLTDKRIGSHTHIQLNWDDEHQLSQSTVIRTGRPGIATRYIYDAFGRRVAKLNVESSTADTVKAATTFVWDGNRLLQQRVAQLQTGQTITEQSLPNAYHCTTFIYEPDSFVPLAQLQWQEGVAPKALSHTNQAANDASARQADPWQATGTDDPALGFTRSSRAGGQVYGLNGQTSHTDQTALTAAIPASLQALNQDGINIRYYHCDQIGLPRELTDELGAIVWRASFKTWGGVEQMRHATHGLQLAAHNGHLTQAGERLTDEATGGTTQLQPIRFQGQYFDEETGLHYNRFRYYDANVGRFVSADPIGLAGGMNEFRYSPNASSFVDPLGLNAKCAKCDIPCPPGFADPKKINFSQRTVSDNVGGYIDDMKAGKWDWLASGPLRVMDVGGQMVSYDNRRLMAARMAGIPCVPIEKVNPSDLMPGSKKTWAQQFAKRFADDRNVAAGGVVPPGGLGSLPGIAPKK
jgi:RHS repeat-associated protein